MRMNPRDFGTDLTDIQIQIWSNTKIRIRIPDYILCFAEIALSECSCFNFYQPPRCQPCCHLYQPASVQHVRITGCINIFNKLLNLIFAWYDIAFLC